MWIRGFPIGESAGNANVGGTIIGGTSGSVLFVDSSGNLGQDNDQLYWDVANYRVGIGTLSPGASLDITEAVSASGTPEKMFQVTGAAHTAITASTQWSPININLGQTYQWAQGALATQRFIAITAPTVAFATGASTATDVATLAISGAPAAGTNATITNAHTVWSQAGMITAQEDTIGTGQTTGLWVRNNTAATAGNQKFSPMLTMTGFGWKTDATAASQAVDFAMQVQPIQGAAAPTGNLIFYSRVNAGSWTTQFGFSSGGIFLDANKNSWLAISSTGTAVNYVTLANAATTGSPAISATGSDTDISMFVYAKGTGSVTIRDNANSASLFSVSSATGAIDHNPAAVTSAISTTTGQFVDVGAATHTVTDSGTVAAWLGTAFQAPTITKGTAVTVTDAATVYVAGIPAAGGSVTITNAYPAWLRRDSIGTGQLGGVLLSNETAAAAGAQQYSPGTIFRGYGWKTDATAASQPVEFCTQVIPVQGAAAPSGNFTIHSRINTGSWTTVFSLNSDGTNNGITTYGLNTFRRDNVGVNVAASAALANFTSASAGNQKFSPAVQLEGRGWKTNTTAASQAVDFHIQAQPVQGLANPGGNLVFYGRINAGTNNQMVTFSAPGESAPGANGSGFDFKGNTFTDNATAGSGTAALWTYFSIQTPTLAASNTSVTTTDAATFYINAVPTAGTNQTIASAHALLAKGRGTIDIASVGTAKTDGFVVRNMTAAADGAQQYSPMIRWRGAGWKTDATAASQTVDFAMQCRPIQGAAAPTGALDISYAVNGGAHSTIMSITSTGLLAWIAGNTQTTVGAAGAASAPPAAPTRWLKIQDSDGTTLVVPAYAAS